MTSKRKPAHTQSGRLSVKTTDRFGRPLHRYEIRRQGFTGLEMLVDTSVTPAETGLTANVAARRGSDGVWRPTAGHTQDEMRQALSALGRGAES